MKRYFLLVLLICAIALSGCATTMRYSDEEIKDFPPSVQKNIRKGEVTPGMTRLQVRYSWGGPDVITVLTPAEGGGERGEWSYQKLRVFKTRLIFTNDKVTEIISTEPGV